MWGSFLVVHNNDVTSTAAAAVCCRLAALSPAQPSLYQASPGQCLCGHAHRAEQQTGSIRSDPAT